MSDVTSLTDAVFLLFLLLYLLYFLPRVIAGAIDKELERGGGVVTGKGGVRIALQTAFWMVLTALLGWLWLGLRDRLGLPEPEEVPYQPSPAAVLFAIGLLATMFIFAFALPILEELRRERSA